MINADVLDVVEATVALGADPAKARSWWLGEISRIANEKDVAIKDLPISATDVAEIVALVNAGELTDKLARQVVEGVIAGEGKPSAVIAARGIKVVSDLFPDPQFFTSLTDEVSEPSAQNGLLLAHPICTHGKFGWTNRAIYAKPN